MGIDTFGEIEQIKSRASQDRQLADSEDISTGAETAIGNVSAWTLFLDVEGQIDITLEFSPDGDNWYTPEGESPLSYDSATTDVLEIGYDVAAVRLTGSNGTNVTAQTFEVV